MGIPAPFSAQILHLCLQGREASVHLVVRVTLINAHQSCRKLGIASGNLHNNHNPSLYAIYTVRSTVETPYKGHVGTSHFVLYREVFLSLEVKNVLVL